MKKLFLFTCFLSLVALQSSARFDFTPTIREAYHNIIRLRLDEGKRLLDSEAKQNPSNALPLLYYNYIDFLKAFLTEEESYSDTLRHHAEQRLHLLEHESKDSPFFLFSKAEIILQVALIKVKFRENISAAFDIRKSYKLAEQNNSLFPSFILNRKLVGLLHAMVGVVPKEHRWLTRLAGMEGTVIQGADEMTKMLVEINHTDYADYREEVLFYLTQLQSSLALENLRENPIADTLQVLSKESLLMTYSFVNLAMKAGKNEEALDALNRKEVYAGTFPFSYLFYKKGMLHLRNLDVTAEADFREYLAHFHGINFIKSVYQKLGWIALLNGDVTKYHSCMDSCLLLGKTVVDDDIDASMEAEGGDAPNIQLLRTRLLSDGGYYARALTEIKRITDPANLSFKDQLEYYYRYARIYHKTGQVEKAIQYYVAALLKGVNEKYYYAANSALLLGNIFEERKDFTRAGEYYHQCLAMRHHDYENSIDQKAQAGLERVQGK